jgi:hypothetical protein
VCQKVSKSQSLCPYVTHFDIMQTRGSIGKLHDSLHHIRKLNIICTHIYVHVGASSSVVVKALCYKPEESGLET